MEIIANVVGCLALILATISLVPLAVTLWVEIWPRIKWLSRTETKKERYFLYDPKAKEWVETTKDPTGGKDAETD